MASQPLLAYRRALLSLWSCIVDLWIKIPPYNNHSGAGLIMTFWYFGASTLPPRCFVLGSPDIDPNLQWTCQQQRSSYPRSFTVLIDFFSSSSVSWRKHESAAYFSGLKTVYPKNDQLPSAPSSLSSNRSNRTSSAAIMWVSKCPLAL